MTLDMNETKAARLPRCGPPPVWVRSLGGPSHDVLESQDILPLIMLHCAPNALGALARVNKKIEKMANKTLWKHNFKRQNGSLVFWAAEHGRIETLERCYQFCKDEDMDMGINDNSASREEATVQALSPCLEKKNVLFYPLHVAAMRGHTEVVDWLLAHGARIDAEAKGLCLCKPGITPLVRPVDLVPATDPPDVNDGHDAHHLRFEEDFPRIRFHTPPHTPVHTAFHTPLHYAICHGEESTVRLLLRRGASILVDGKNSATTALHTAARCNDSVTVQHIIEKGLVDVNRIDENGWTALHAITMHAGHTTLLPYLLMAGADPGIRSGVGGQTALATACSLGHFKLALALIHHGARDFRGLGGARMGLLYSYSDNPLFHAVMPLWVRRRDHASPLLHIDAEDWEQDRAAFIRCILSSDADAGLGQFKINNDRGDTWWILGPSKAYDILQYALHYGLDLRLMRLLLDYEMVSEKRRTLHTVLSRPELVRHSDAAALVSLLLDKGARVDTMHEEVSVMEQAMKVTGAERHHPILVAIKRHASIADLHDDFLHHLAIKFCTSGKDPDLDSCRRLIELFKPRILPRFQKWISDNGIRQSICQRQFPQTRFMIDISPNIQDSCILAVAWALRSYHRVHSSLVPGFQPGDEETMDKLIRRLQPGAGGLRVPWTVTTSTWDQGVMIASSGGSTLLHYACAFHHPNQVALLLNNFGHLIDETDDRGTTPLYHAATSLCSKSFNLLLSKGADPFLFSGPEVLGNLVYDACVNGQELKNCCTPGTEAPSGAPLMLETILDYVPLPPSQNDPTGPIVWGYEYCALRNIQSLKCIMGKGGDPNGGQCPWPPLVEAIRLIEESSINIDGNRHVYEDACMRFVPCIQILLDHGADVHKAGTSRGSFWDFVKEAFRYAANLGHPLRGVVRNEGNGREYAMGQVVTFWRVTTDPDTGVLGLQRRPDHSGVNIYQEGVRAISTWMREETLEPPHKRARLA